MKEIKITKGFTVIVDDEDFERVNQFKWTAVRRIRKSRDVVYARRNVKGKNLQLHRFILDCYNNDVDIDHINGNPLDNRKENLRQCNRSQNMMNMLNSKRGSSKFKGVSWDKENNKWSAQLTLNYKHVRIGRYKTEIEAAIAYNKKATELFGEYALLNNIDDRNN